MKYTIRGYALAHKMSLHQAFCKAWRDTYVTTPDFKLVREDTDRYMNIGAIPPYVTAFMKKQERTKAPFLKLYMPYWVQQ